MSNLATLEIVPSTQRRLALAGCIGALAGASLIMLLVGGISIKILALLILALCVCGSVVIWKRFSHRQHIVLASSGLRLPAFGGWIPWTDIEELAVFKFKVRMIGVRLSRYDRFLTSLTPAEVQTIEGRLKSMQMFARLLLPARAAQFNPTDVSSYGDLLSDAENLSLLGDIAVAKLTTAAGIMKWNREHVGFELSISALEIDRSLEQFVQLLEQYRRAAIS